MVYIIPLYQWAMVWVDHWLTTSGGIQFCGITDDIFCGLYNFIISMGNVLGGSLVNYIWGPTVCMVCLCVACMFECKQPLRQLIRSFRMLPVELMLSFRNKNQLYNSSSLKTVDQEFLDRPCASPPAASQCSPFSPKPGPC